MTHILLYYPNIIGYIRILLIFVALYYTNTNPTWFVLLMSLSALLDMFDGILARQFNQCTKFGEVFDVFIDNLQRTILHCINCTLYPKYAVLFALSACVEWNVQVLMHANSMIDFKNWKQVETMIIPKWLNYLFSNNFKNPLGILAILGVTCLPMYWYVKFHNVTLLSSNYIGMLLVCGRLIALSAELFLSYDYIKRILLPYKIEKD